MTHVTLESRNITFLKARTAEKLSPLQAVGKKYLAQRLHQDVRELQNGQSFLLLTSGAMQACLHNGQKVIDTLYIYMPRPTLKTLDFPRKHMGFQTIISDLNLTISGTIRIVGPQNWSLPVDSPDTLVWPPEWGTCPRLADRYPSIPSPRNGPENSSPTESSGAT